MCVCMYMYICVVEEFFHVFVYEKCHLTSRKEFQNKGCQENIWTAMIKYAKKLMTLYEVQA